MNNTARRGRGVWCGSEAKRRYINDCKGVAGSAYATHFRCKGDEKKSLLETARERNGR